MIAPTPGSAASSVDAEAKAERAAATTQDARSVTPDWTSAEGRAREMLDRLGRADHPDAETDPIHALYQVAVDYRCSAHGYRELYLHHLRHARE
ncbi:MAG: hypothetical protein QNJ90_14430 [Planctomycetota bacterium]|nr:hypothetical protein [Planctomycetota bacterium]